MGQRDRLSGDLVPSLRCTREAEEVHRVIACRAAEWTRSGLASAPLPYLAVSNYLSNYLDRSDYLHLCEDPCCCRAIPFVLL